MPYLKDRTYIGRVIEVDPLTGVSIEHITDWPDVEYVTPLGEVTNWRQLFFIEMAKQAPRALLELGRLCNFSVKIQAFEDAISGADGLKDQRPPRAIPRLKILLPKYMKAYEYQVYKWLKRYGLSRDKEGDLPEWVLQEVILNTYHYWLEDNPEAIGKKFAPLGIPRSNDLEQVLAMPSILSGDLQPATPEEQQDWKQQQQKYQELLTDINPSIIAPLGLNSWAPYLQTEKSYLNSIEQKILNRLRTDTILRYAPEDHQKSFAKAFTEELRVKYCKALRDYYEQNGYKRMPEKPSADKHIKWTVQVQVLGNSFAEVKRREEAEGQSYTLPAINKSVHRVLDILDLSLRESITRGRPKGSKNSTQSPHRPGKKK